MGKRRAIGGEMKNGEKLEIRGSKNFFHLKNKILRKFQKFGQKFFFGVLRKIFFKKFCFKKHKN